MRENKEGELNQQHYSFSLKRIQLLEKSLGIVAKRESSEKYDFDVSLKINLESEAHLSIHLFEVKVKLKADNKPLASISIVCVFEINNYDEITVKSTHGPELPQGLLTLLNTVVIGTMRGVMFSEFRGTALDNVVFPVLDPSKFERTETAH